MDLQYLFTQSSPWPEEGISLPGAPKLVVEKQRTALEQNPWPETEKGFNNH